MYKILGLILGLVLFATALSVGMPEAESPMISTSCAASTVAADATTSSWDCPEDPTDYCAVATFPDGTIIFHGGAPIVVRP